VTLAYCGRTDTRRSRKRTHELILRNKHPLWAKPQRDDIRFGSIFALADQSRLLSFVARFIHSLSQGRRYGLDGSVVFDPKSDSAISLTKATKAPVRRPYCLSRVPSKLHPLRRNETWQHNCVQVDKEEIAYMAWDIEGLDGCVVVRMNTNKVNVQNDHFFADLHAAFDRLEREFSDLPVVLTGQGDVFSAGIDFQYSFGIFGSGSQDTIRQWYRTYRETNLRIFQYPRPTVAAVNGHAIAGGLITALDCDFRVAARKSARFGLNEVPIGIRMQQPTSRLLSTHWEGLSRRWPHYVASCTSLRKRPGSVSFTRLLSLINCSTEPSATRDASRLIATPPTQCPKRLCRMRS
jgi:Enoyl-CoA hydratase/isomerase